MHQDIKDIAREVMRELIAAPQLAVIEREIQAHSGKPWRNRKYLRSLRDRRDELENQYPHPSQHHRDDAKKIGAGK